MKNNHSKLGLAILLLSVTSLSAHSRCVEYTVSGSITTENINPVVQAGTTNLVLTPVSGNLPPIILTGGQVGKINSFDPQTFVTLLDHRIFFDGENTIETTDDLASNIPLDPQGCKLLADITISNFRGTGIFKRVSGEIKANGTVDCAHGNSFLLSGHVCLKKARPPRRH